MKVGIIGGGIAGLSTAYYIRKFGLPVSEILIFEASNRYGGWVNSKKIEDTQNNRNVIFEYGPRTLRISTYSFQEINSLKLAYDLNLKDNVEFISKTHPASTNRYIYLNNKLNKVGFSFLRPNPHFNMKSGASYLINEFRTPPRDASIKDESVYDFVTRRLGTEVAEYLVDPLFKGIYGGDIKKLGAATILKDVYKGEPENGSILMMMLRNSIKNRPPIDSKIVQLYPDLLTVPKEMLNQSVWRLKDGMQQLTDKLVQNLSFQNNVKMHLNEPCVKLNISNNSQEIETTKGKYQVDAVFSAIYGRQLSNILSDNHKLLKNSLAKIDAVNMVVVNLYFSKNNVLPFQGFGYLIPTSENSPILGCIFDSVFASDQNHSVLTVMMGGAWYDKYIKDIESDPQKILLTAVNELKKQIKLNEVPDEYEVSILKDCIPQYKIGYQDILSDIDGYLKENKLDHSLYLVGNSFNGVGVNDVIFNSRKMVQESLNENPLIKKSMS